MAWTTTDLDAIESAIASGELEVTFADKTVKYRSIPELLAAREVIRDRLVADGLLTDTRTRVSVASFSKE